MKIFPFLVFLLTAAALPAFANEASETVKPLHLIGSPLGIISVVLFIGAYVLVILEERLQLRKSKPVMLAAGIIWALVAFTYEELGMHNAPELAIRDSLLEYAELFLFLLVAMTYINSMSERNVFQALRSWLISKRFSLRGVFWITGFLAFIISPVADNMTTALLMGAVVLAVGGNNKKFIAMACINIVVGANAGGAFSPFGDITTLMVWQKGVVQFREFFDIFLPSLTNWLIPAFCMNLAIGKAQPQGSAEIVMMKVGAKRIIFLFLATIITAICFHNFLDLPAANGMMLGLGYLGFFAFYLKKLEDKRFALDAGPLGSMNPTDNSTPPPPSFDLFKRIANAEWDTLLFFYGVMLCVGGLSQFGYLAVVSHYLYTDLGPTPANVLIGVLSSVVDNIPVMYAVLTMHPEMHHGQWLLVTLTAGVGGSLLSIGSAAGVALMGSARGIYTFATHLKWTPVIILGYAASIIVHLFVNSHLM